MTAVEYLEKIINDCRKYQHQYQKDIDKAKEMEKQQQANKYSKEEVIECFHEYFIYRIDEDIEEELPFSKWLETYKKQIP